ncbi:hypothetical protein CR513_21905, partial [Mucuna pruriens]
MTTRMKIDAHARTLSMEFGDNLEQFNIFEVMKHPTKDHSLCSIDIIDELVEEYMQLGITKAEFDSNNQMKVKSDSNNQLEAKSDSSNQSCKETKADSDFKQLIPHLNKVGQPNPRSISKLSPPYSPPTELKPLSNHLKYAYLDDHQHFPVIIANNLQWEQEEKLLKVLRKHQKEVGWMLSHLLETNPSICMHKILLEEGAQSIRQQ